MAEVDQHPEAMLGGPGHMDMGQELSPSEPEVGPEGVAQHDSAGDEAFDIKADRDAQVAFEDYDDEEYAGDEHYADDMMQIDLDTADVEELERQKQMLLEQKKKLIEQLKASGFSADTPEFAALEAEVQEAEAEAAAGTPGKKRGRPRKYSRADGSLSASGEYDGKRRRGRPPKKRTKLDESGAYEADSTYLPDSRVADSSSAYTPKLKYSTDASDGTQ